MAGRILAARLTASLVQRGGCGAQVACRCCCGLDAVGWFYAEVTAYFVLKMRRRGLGATPVACCQMTTHHQAQIVGARAVALALACALALAQLAEWGLLMVAMEFRLALLQVVVVCGPLQLHALPHQEWVRLTSPRRVTESSNQETFHP